MSVCTTRLSNGPRSRLKTGPCNAGEIDEWNLYCTEGANRITREQAESEATGDFNYIYTFNLYRGQQAGPNQTPSGDDVDNSPPMVAAFGVKPPRNSGSSSTSSSSSSSQTQASTSDTPVPANCPAPSQATAAGAALGGMFGGRNAQAGAALGGLLGAAAGGKAKKPAGCP
jgi:hypothetical protein